MVKCFPRRLGDENGLRDNTQILQYKNLWKVPIKHENACVYTDRLCVVMTENMAIRNDFILSKSKQIECFVNVFYSAVYREVPSVL